MGILSLAVYTFYSVKITWSKLLVNTSWCASSKYKVQKWRFARCSPRKPDTDAQKQAHHAVWRLHRAAQHEFESDLTLEEHNTLTIYVKTRCVAFKCVAICYFTPQWRYLIDVRYQQRLHVPSTCQEISADTLTEDILQAWFPSSDWFTLRSLLKSSSW